MNTDTLSVVVNNCSMGIENNVASDINLYPNPNNGQFTIRGLSEGAIVRLFNELGMHVLDLNETNSVVSVSMVNMNNGMYVVRIFTKDGSFVSQHKVLKQ